ncbi:IS1 family transposase [Bergeyella porcorum]|uniref:IS1 family transposase n=1 Tax=Bergeyella porcorum TaxID=1735111 RepID=UPI00399CAB8A
MSERNPKYRKNELNLRTHLKRLGRKTIAYSKSLSQLSAIIKIYLYSKTTSLC